MPITFDPLKYIPIITIRISGNLFRYCEKQEVQVVCLRVNKKSD
jgi:hypothetical protein